MTSFHGRPLIKKEKQQIFATKRRMTWDGEQFALNVSRALPNLYGNQKAHILSSLFSTNVYFGLQLKMFTIDVSGKFRENSTLVINKSTHIWKLVNFLAPFFFGGGK